MQKGQQGEPNTAVSGDGCTGMDRAGQFSRRHPTRASVGRSGGPWVLCPGGGCCCCCCCCCRAPAGLANINCQLLFIQNAAGGVAAVGACSCLVQCHICTTNHMQPVARTCWQRAFALFPFSAGDAARSVLPALQWIRKGFRSPAELYGGVAMPVHSRRQ
jgi:hypothetical protein